MIALLAIATAGAQPAVLILKTKDGYQLAPFSSLQRCEAARLEIIAERERNNAEMDRRGFKVIVPAAFWSKCVPG